MALSKSKSDGKKKKFVYQERTEEQARKHSERQGVRFDSIFKGGAAPMFKAKVGWNAARILPPTWDEAEHYAFPVTIHRNIGPDNATYLCLAKNDWHKDGNNNKCPMCALQMELKKQGDEEDAKKVARQQLMVCYALDREADDPDEVHLWPMSFTMDKDIQALTFSRRGGITKIDHPDSGNDVEFRRNGTGLKTRYLGHKLLESSEMHESEKKQDKILEYLTDNPIPEQMNFYDADYLQKVIDGMTNSSRDDDDDDEDVDRKPPKRSKRKERDDDEDEADERPSKKKTGRVRAKDDDEDDDEADDDKPSKSSKRRKKDDDDEEDDPPFDADKKAKSKSKRRKDDDDDDEADDDEDEKPSRSSKSKRKKDDDDEEDDPEPETDDDEDDSDDDEKPRKGRASRKKDDDEDEADEKPSRSSKKSKRRADPDDEDDADEADDEDEKPSKSKSKRRKDDDDDEDEKPSRSSKSKRRADPDDDEDSDDDSDDEDDKPRRRRK